MRSYFVALFALFLFLAKPADALIDGGPKSGCVWINPDSYVTYTYFWYSGYNAGASIAASNGVDADVYVYDNNGIRVAAGASSSSYESVIWSPRWNGVFTVKIVNSSSYYGSNVCISLL